MFQKGILCCSLIYLRVFNLDALNHYNRIFINSITNFQVTISNLQLHNIIDLYFVILNKV
jgi:hypothetical protein